MRILVIDDDAELCELLSQFLQNEGFEVRSAYSGEAGLREALTSQYSLVVLDVMLPGTDGFTVLRRLREKSKIPVLMLTARGEDVDRILGLEFGADDYMPKPFNPRELAARIRAILRRSQPEPDSSETLSVNGVSLDSASRTVQCDGRPVELTSFEFEILRLLMRSAGRVLSRDQLMESLYNRKSTPFDRSIDVHIAHVRKKLETGRTLIKTVRGVGYQFLRSPEDESA